MLNVLFHKMVTLYLHTLYYFLIWLQFQSGGYELEVQDF